MTRNGLSHAQDDLWPAPFRHGSPVSGTVAVPGSKSLTNRYLVLAALASEPSLVRRPLHSRDSALMVAALQTLGELGARRLEAVVGPSVCPRCYEVPAQLRDEAAALTPAAAAVSWTGTPAIDVASAVVQQLADSDLEVSLRWLPGCTRERDDLYSYRRDGTTGRFAGVVRLLPPERVA